MLVSALIGGAGVKILELVVAWRKDATTTDQAEKASISAMETKIREELRLDNEKLRARLDALESKKTETKQLEAKNPDGTTIPPVPTTADSTGKIKKIVEDEMESMTSRVKEVMSANEELRNINKSLSHSVKLMAQTITDLKAELEVYENEESDPPPPPPVSAPRKKK